MSAIDDAIAAAKAQAAQAAPQPAAASTAVAAQGQVPATAAPNVTALPTQQPTLSAAEMLNGSFSVGAYIKVSEDGIKIGDSKLIEKLLVKIDLSEVFYYFGVKYGNPAVYKKTANRVTAFDGTPWQQVLATAAQVDPKFRGDYRSADVPMTLLAAATDVAGNPVEKGEIDTRLGKSLSTTEWKEWEGFLRTITKDGLNQENAVVQVVVGFKPRKNSNNTWGVLTFELIGEYVEDDLGGDETPAEAAAA